ncbi:tRNA-dihydrouridine synthase [Candidatus Peregrinibacteria bacterium]|nr:MAG: tRNA-dihydrouridine synthase [Candidatus Peregrinibacteria bacterium]
MNRGFWDHLKAPIIGLAPMDGVTDSAYRYMVCKYSKPTLVMTEFTNVEGLARGAIGMLKAFEYDEIERPVVAQIYGSEVESFYKVALMNCFLGFDGIDINMGCPANKVARRGSGAGLIRTPDLAKLIVQTVQKACKDFFNGITLEEANIRPKIIAALKKIDKYNEKDRRLLPVSVKTRVGFDSDITLEWIRHLIEVQPANITLHGRTLKQMYMGLANWESIGKAASLCKNTGITLLGNGDIKSIDEAHQKMTQYGVDGVLVGRGTFGNPWFFSNHSPTPQERAQAAIEHCKVFEKLNPGSKFFIMRKHLGWYCRDFDGARETRSKLMQSENSEEVKNVFKEVFPALEEES